MGISMADDDINIDEIVAYMAVKHELIIPRNDPVILGVLLNDVIHKKNIDRINAEFVKYQISLNDVYKTHEITATQAFHKIIDECNSIAKKAIEESTKNAAAILKNEMQHHIKNIHMRNEQYKNEITNSKIIALFSAAIAFISMLITIFILIK